MGGQHKIGSYTIDVQRWFKKDFIKILGEPTRTSWRDPMPFWFIYLWDSLKPPAQMIPFGFPQSIGLSCFFWQESSICDGQSHEFPVDFPSGAPLRPSKDLPKLVRLWGTSKLASWVMSSWCHDTIFERCWVSLYLIITIYYIYIYIYIHIISYIIIEVHIIINPY